MGADLEEDLKRLEQEQLLGDPAHKALMTTVIQVRRPLIHDSLIIFDQGQHEALANCVFNMSVQCCVSPTRPLSVGAPPVPCMAKLDMIALLAILKRKAPKSHTEPLDNLSVSLLVSLLYLLDFGVNLERFEVGLNSAQRSIDGPILQVQSQAFAKDPEVLAVLETPWENTVLQRTINFVLGLASNDEDYTNLALNSGQMDAEPEGLRNLLYMACSLTVTGVFHYIRTAVLSSKQFNDRYSFYPFFMDVFHFVLIKFLEDWAQV